MEDEDKKLTASYLNGDTEALAKLVERNLGLVYRYGFRMTRNDEDAQDVAQETFVKLWRNIQKFDSSKNFRTWLLGIAHNTAIDLLRKKKDIIFSDVNNIEEGGSFEESIVDVAPLPLEVFEQAEQKKLLDNALGQISPASREVLILYHEENLTFAQIGAILNKPLNTVKSQYRRALVSLRKILSE